MLITFNNILFCTIQIQPQIQIQALIQIQQKQTNLLTTPQCASALSRRQPIYTFACSIEKRILAPEPPKHLQISAHGGCSTDIHAQGQGGSWARTHCNTFKNPFFAAFQQVLISQRQGGWGGWARSHPITSKWPFSAAETQALSGCKW